jgi:hypothetical protein
VVAQEELIQRNCEEPVEENPCSGCIHEPKRGEPYPSPCGECARWWSDSYAT